MPAPQLYLIPVASPGDEPTPPSSPAIGRIASADGEIFRTRKGELSLRVDSLRLLSKSLRPLPDKFPGVADQELRYRQRYVDLIMTEGTRDTFLARSRIITAIRQIMSEADFLEVETPMLHPIPGGAAAKPFITHHNALDMQMYLRIAPELYLKRLIVGGFERVFEINRNFRNEGVSPRHNPEFTMMEFYAAYTDYRWLMDYTESLIRETARRVCGTATLSYQGQPLDLERAFDRLTIVEAILKHTPGYAPAQLQDEAWLRGELRRLGADVDGPALAHAGLGALQLALFEETAKRSSGTRPSSSTIRWKSRRWRGPPTPSPASRNASSCSPADARSPTAFPS
ncbi:Elongation factor P--(R)-beta-lysine ligase [Castellaniella denitrificans]